MYWVNLVIIAIIALGMWQGFRRGLMAQLFQILSIVAAIVASFALYGPLGNWFAQQLQVPLSFSRPMALIVLMIVLSYVFQLITAVLQRLVAPILEANTANRAAGSVLGGLRQVAMVSVGLALIVTLPLPQTVKSELNSSLLSKSLIKLALDMDNVTAKLLHNQGAGFLDYQIVQENDPTTTALNYTVANPTEDSAGEASMLNLTNVARRNAGVKPVQANPQLAEVARNHAQDMLAKGYFSHISPQGKDPAARVQEANITVSALGENLAAAPTVDIAQAGLLASASHRKNILNKDFTDVGIAVLDAGIHGKMIVEEFARIP